MSSLHRNNITQHLILVPSNRKWYFNLLENLNFSSIIEPLQFIRSRVCNQWKSKFHYHHVTSIISTTSTINNQSTYLIHYQASSIKQVFPLFLEVIFQLHDQNPSSYQDFPTFSS